MESGFCLYEADKEIGPTIKLPIIHKYLLWANEYRESLYILIKDLEFLMSEPISASSKQRIFLAVDFCDVYEYCFPNLNLFGKNPVGLDYRQRLIERQLARLAFFNFLNKLYKLPIILLPPYAAECLDFFKKRHLYLNDVFMRSKYEELKSYVEKLIYEFKDINGHKINSANFILLYEKINEYSPDLAYIMSPYFSYQMDGLCELMDKKLRPNNIEIENLMSMLKEAQNIPYDKINKTLDEIRPNRYLPNKRDAKAIKYLEEINKQLPDNEILILISSANNINTYKELQGKNSSHTFIERVINKEKYQLIRNTKPFYAAIVEMCKVVVSKKRPGADTLDFEKIDIQDLLVEAKRSLFAIENFLISLDENNIQSGRLRIDSREDSLFYFEEFMENIKKMHREYLVVLLEKYSFMDENKVYLYNYFKNEKNLQAGFDKIKTAIESRVQWESFLGDIQTYFFDKKIIAEQIGAQYYRGFKDGKPVDELLVGKIDKSQFNTDQEKLNLVKDRIQNRNLNYPIAPIIIKFDEKNLILLDKESNNNQIFLLEDKDGFLFISMIDLEILYQDLKCLFENASIKDINVFEISFNHSMNTMKDKILPIFDKFNYYKKDQLKYYYDNLSSIEIEKKLKHMEFGTVQYSA